MVLMGFRAIVLSVFVLGLALAAAWHAAAPLTEGDALHVAAILGGGPGTSPPGPVSERLLDVGMRAVRAVWAPTGLFRAAHLAGGLWLAIAAALTAGVAARSAAGRHPRAGTGLAAGLFAGCAVLLGADTGRLGLEASPVPVLLALLAGSATAFTARRPWPFLGGLLAGLAVADHPFVLFLLPAWGALALGSTLRDRPGNAGRTIRTGWFGFALGLLALLMTGPPRAALAAWIGGPDGPFWRPVGPSGWGAGLLDAVFAAWHATGPLGFVLGLAGVVAFFTGRARLARPFLLAFAVPAAALVLGRAADAEVARALTGWAFVFWTVPSFAAAWGRFAGDTEHGPDPPEPVMVRADFRAPVVALLAGGLLFALNSKTLDRSADRDPAWARSVVRALPANAVFFTGNAAH
ncbi:MAG: hypothetical protein KC591_02180, partial [Gemmatimonadetes bacterium]|nr:hypothetical protein [Gemmatimonadota bacterium]